MLIGIGIGTTSSLYGSCFSSSAIIAWNTHGETQVDSAYSVRLDEPGTGIGRSNFLPSCDGCEQDPRSNRACGFPAHGLPVVVQSAAVVLCRDSGWFRAACEARACGRHDASSATSPQDVGSDLCVCAPRHAGASRRSYRPG